MLTKAIVTAAAAGLLAASAAYAGDDAHKTAAHNSQTSATASTTVNPSINTSTYNSTSASMSADTGISSNVSTTVPMSTGDALALGGTVEIVASTPVADTPQNRALYGGPMSATGKRTAATGN